MRYLAALLALLRDVFLMLLWWLLPWITAGGLIHSPDLMKRIPGLVLWGLFGGCASWVLLSTDVKRLRRL